MRINKFMADNGIASRRASDKLIEDGVVEINGRIARLGDEVNENDVVRVNGNVVGRDKQLEYYVMNKPKGYICTASDDRGRKTVIDLLPPTAGRVFPVGRLDYDTEGLLILTNDGALAYKLTNPASEIPKTYVARIEGVVTEQVLNRIRPGIEIEKGVFTKKCKIKILEVRKEYTRVQIILTEGKNREIRKMFDAVGKKVIFLKRIGIGDLNIRGLNRGAVRKLSQEEIFYLSNL